MMSEEDLEYERNVEIGHHLFHVDRHLSYENMWFHMRNKMLQCECREKKGYINCECVYPIRKLWGKMELVHPIEKNVSHAK